MYSRCINCLCAQLLCTINVAIVHYNGEEGNCMVKQRQDIPYLSLWVGLPQTHQTAPSASLCWPTTYLHMMNYVSN